MNLDTLKEEIPESWDRYEAMKFVSDLIKSETKAFSVTVTSIRIYDNFGKKSILVHFNKVYLFVDIIY
jgi:hypothetical protein